MVTRNFTPRVFTLLLTASTALTSSTVVAQTPTFHLDIAPIVYANCTQCHRIGEIAPQPFTNYEEVLAYGDFIAYVTASGYMPPWTPDHTYRSLQGERYLTAEEIALIADWVDAGMLEGDPADNPGLPEFPEGSQVGTPDLVLTMSEPYVHGGDMLDQYQVFVLPTGITETQEVRAVEIRPGNLNIAHHGLLGYYVGNEADVFDAADPDPGYESFGGYGVSVDDQLFGGWVPGTAPMIFPSTIGKVMEPGSQLLLQMHYGPTNVTESDVTEVNIFYAEEPIEREVELALMDPFNLDEPFIIFPNEVVTFHGTLYMSADVSLLSITPHCHLLGQSWEIYALSPDATDTIPLISIPQWDFHWQGIFSYPSLIKVPAGYVIHAYCTYDNTANNLENPNDPPITVSWGEFTGDEMYVVFLQYIPYLPGDEEISLSAPDPVHTFLSSADQLLPAYPNPAVPGESIHIGFNLKRAGSVDLAVYDASGRLVAQPTVDEQYGLGFHEVGLPTAGWSPGRYTISLRSADGTPHLQQLVLVK